MEEVSYTTVFVDGTKIEANANIYSFVWAKAVEKNLNKLEKRIEAEIGRIAGNYFLKENIRLEVSCVTQFYFNLA